MKTILFCLFLCLSAVSFGQPKNDTPPSNSPFVSLGSTEVIKGGSIYTFEANMINRGILAFSCKHRFGTSPMTFKFGYGKSFTKDFYLINHGFDAGVFDAGEIIKFIGDGKFTTHLFNFGIGVCLGKQRNLRGFSINAEIKIGSAVFDPKSLTHEQELRGETSTMRKKTQHYGLTLNYIWAPEKLDRVLVMEFGCGIGLMIDSVNDSYLKTYFGDPYKWVFVESRLVDTMRVAPIFTCGNGIGSKRTRV